MNIASFLLPKEEVSYLQDRMTLKQGLERLHRSGFSAIPVIDVEDRYVGVISEGDFLWNAFYCDRKVEGTAKRLERTTVREIIQCGKIKPACIDMTMESLLELIRQQSFVPVIDDRSVFIGIVTRSVILDHFIRQTAAPQGGAAHRERRRQ